MLIKIFKKARQLVKQEVQLNHDLRRIKKLSIDYEALKNIANAVSLKNVCFEITTNEEVKIVIKPTVQNTLEYKSFADRYQEVQI